MAISLEKGHKINLVTSNSNLGEISINFKTPQKKGFIAKFFSPTAVPSSAADLDLGCLFELKNGDRAAVQALGNGFGSYDEPPYVQLYLDEQIGENLTRETLRINGDKISEIRRILVYTFIYSDVLSWQNTDITISYPQAEDIIVKLDGYDCTKNMCGLLLFENIDDTTFSVENIVQFYEGHTFLDEAFNWGINWQTGTND
ncbi:MAG: hypothetical protein BEN18_11300 [Epulopiscium sp. Nuni2H_MBin001]|nr:MAG: hypothetical protein BEN18_11300 [Epulopiscium sp. Nuni2H_MBin001]